ncbi:MAG: hypothetical protein EXQ53_11810 [Acidobacteria bacterium]|nr:hypothetical protein [Acidobacteriota bacterium]
MRRFLQPVAACALFVVGAIPATTLACQLACATSPPATQPIHHRGHHQSPAATTVNGTATHGDSVVTSGDPVCDHLEAAVPAIPRAAAPRAVPTTAALSNLLSGLLSRPAGLRVNITAHSPPGTPPRPFALRI